MSSSNTTAWNSATNMLNLVVAGRIGSEYVGYATVWPKDGAYTSLDCTDTRGIDGTDPAADQAAFNLTLSG
ncbi:MAG: hypothetical protein OXU75_20970 [Deltaproteobacteria bacterium]|nr:hypothetical protein [Deltaproteobacteria bacterium]